MVLTLIFLATFGLFAFKNNIAISRPVQKPSVKLESKVVKSLIKKEIHQKRETIAPTLGIDRMSLYIDSLKGKRIAIVANQTSVIANTHLVDTLLALNLNVVKVFAPEHGFRGEMDAGQHIDHSIDPKTKLPLISLYGANKKPSPTQLEDIDIVIYDIQDVGVRFYTYISTLHYVMEACAESKIKLIVLDRPNPNGHYIDGPVLEPTFKSFVGMHPVPIVYGMTVGEYAKMINGEGWLDNHIKCDLWVIECMNYTHDYPYHLAIAPSPNLRSDLSIALYPSLCLFEATTVSIGRGTQKPFEVYGHPKFPKLGFSFTPVSSPGAKNPKHMNKVCQAIDLSSQLINRVDALNLNYLIHARDLLGDSIKFIDQPSSFNRLAGTSNLIDQIQNGWTQEQIKATWQSGLEKFKSIRVKYLTYD